MEPEFRDGDLVLLDPRAPVVAGNVVVVRHPYKNVELIKYVKTVDPDGFLVLESPAGEDSDQFGRPPLDSVRGTVTLNWKRRSRR